jgi:hypothetical protein
VPITLTAPVAATISIAREQCSQAWAAWLAARRRRPVAVRRRGRIGCLGLLALAAGALISVEFGCRALEAPWSFGAGGRPTLTGTWEGARHARLGTEYRLYVALAYASSSAYSNRYGLSDNLQGEARLCSPTGDVWVYRLTGRANRAGDVITLDFGTPSDGPQMPTPGRIDAHWDSTDTLTITGGDNPLMPDGRFVPSRVVSSADQDDSFVPATLARGDGATFDAACQALRRATP